MKCDLENLVLGGHDKWQNGFICLQKVTQP